MLPPQTGSVRVNLPPHPRGGKQYGGSMNIVSQSCAALLLGAVSLSGCAVDGPTWKGDADAAVLNELAPSGALRVGINYGNPNNATLNPVTGQLSGVAVDLACTLAKGTDRPLTVVGYSGGPPMLAGVT